MTAHRIQQDAGRRVAGKAPEQDRISGGVTERDGSGPIATGAQEHRAPFDLEGTVATLAVLRVSTSNLAAIDAALETKVEDMRGFLEDAPVALDLSRLDGAAGAPTARTLALKPLVECLRKHRLVPLAVCDPNERRAQEAVACGIGVLPKLERAGAKIPQAPRPVAPRRAEPAARPSDWFPTLFITEPVRGGQLVHADRRDAVVVSSVNAGAELIADGSIHVYGVLRGRALAGARGDKEARIFCRSLQASLVSIAGTYLRADQFPEDLRGKPVQISLQADELAVEPALM